MKYSAAELNQLSTAVALERERRRYAGHAAFTRGAWAIIEPGTAYKHNWHLDAISAHLEAVSAGHIKLLIINMPPRHMKSIGVSVTWCPWEWGPARRPWVRWLYASYAGSLSVRDSLKARRIIQSAWYQRLWGAQVQLSGDQNAKLRFENTAAGYRLATSVGGVGTGEGGDRIVVDDPHNVQEAESDAVREATIEWWSKSMSTRINDAETGAHVIVMQRVRENDLSGYELTERAQELRLRTGEVVHLCLPARFEQERRCVTYINKKEFFRDPRTTPGEPLWPARFNETGLRRLEQRLGQYGAAGQLQQRPAPAGGGILKVKHFKLWPAGTDLPDFEHVVQSYDTAFTEQTKNDPTACTVWGVSKVRGRRVVLLLDSWSKRMAYPELRKRALMDWRAEYGGIEGDQLHPPRRPDAVLVENKGSGQSLLQDLRRANVPALPYNPGGADKMARAQIAAPILELDVCYLIESSRDPGLPVSWAREFVHQLEMFDAAEHDDYVDTFTQAMIYLRDANYIELPEVLPDPSDARDYYKERKARVNPYRAGA